MIVTANNRLREWDSAKVVAVPAKKAGEPRLLVERKTGYVLGSREEELIYLPGNPAISLFTGAGGFDLGIEAAGFTTLVQHEWSEHACQTLIANRPNCFAHSALIQGDIRLTSTWDILGAAGLRVGEAHLLVGGPPCQGFSHANSQRGKGPDDRCDLVYEYLRVGRESQPKFFCFENVSGFQDFDKGSYMAEFLSQAFSIGYELVYGLVNAVEYGVPQHRVRFVCMGTRKDLFEIDGMLASLPEPQCFGDDDLNQIVSFESELGLFGEKQSLRKLLRPPGVRYFPDRAVLRTPTPVRGGDSRTDKFHEFYDRLEREEPDRIVRQPFRGNI